MNDNLGDTCLDTPHAEEHFATLVAAAKEQGWLDGSFAAAGKATAWRAPSACTLWHSSRPSCCPSRMQSCAEFKFVLVPALKGCRALRCDCRALVRAVCLADVLRIARLGSPCTDTL